MTRATTANTILSDDDLTRLCMESLYEFHEGMPEECWSIDQECKAARWWKVGDNWRCGHCQMYFDPLREDEHAMRLVKKHNLTLTPEFVGLPEPHVIWFAEWPDETGSANLDLNRAIVESVASEHAKL